MPWEKKDKLWAAFWSVVLFALGTWWLGVDFVMIYLGVAGGFWSGWHQGRHEMSSLYDTVWQRTLNQTALVSRTYNRCMGIAAEVLTREHEAKKITASEYISEQLDELKKEFENARG